MLPILIRYIAWLGKKKDLSSNCHPDQGLIAEKGVCIFTIFLSSQVLFL